MIRYVGCDYARPRLDAFADGELPMGDQVLVETHLRWCQTCAARLEDAQTIGASLRMNARAHADHQALQDGAALAAMQAEVLAQANIEYEQSLAVRVHELFSDMRLWWPALGATVAVALSVGVAGNIWKAASAQQPTSLAAMIENLADPGSNRNPQRLDAAMYLPRVADGGDAFEPAAMLWQEDGPQDEVAAVVVLTKEGTIGGYALLEHSRLRHLSASGPVKAESEAAGVMTAVRRFRFEPAQRPGGQVVAVNMVMLFARTTVKPSHATIDLGTPLARPVLATPQPAAAPKPAGLPPEATSSQDQPPAPRQEDATPIGSATA